MDKQREAFEKKFPVNEDWFYWSEESQDYVPSGSSQFCFVKVAEQRNRLSGWQAATKQAAKKISVIECANKNLYQLNDDFEKQIESLQAELKEEKLQAGFLKIHLDSTKVHLNSCEIALADRDTKNDSLQAEIEQLKNASTGRKDITGDMICIGDNVHILDVDGSYSLGIVFYDSNDCCFGMDNDGDINWFVDYPVKDEYGGLVKFDNLDKYIEGNR